MSSNRRVKFLNMSSSLV